MYTGFTHMCLAPKCAGSFDKHFKTASVLCVKVFKKLLHRKFKEFLNAP